MGPRAGFNVLVGRFENVQCDERDVVSMLLSSRILDILTI